MIFCDRRETEHSQDVIDIVGDDATVMTLACDYIIYSQRGRPHCIEHMTSSGFILDIETGRLEAEKIPKMQRLEPESITLAIVGRPEASTRDGYAIIDGRGQTNWLLKSLYGKRLYYRKILNINIEWFLDNKAFAYYLLECQQWLQEEDKHYYKPVERPSNIIGGDNKTKTRILYFLSGIKPDTTPGVAVGRAEVILSKAISDGASLSDICTWSTREWQSVDSIDKKTARSIVKFLNTDLSKVIKLK